MIANYHIPSTKYSKDTTFFKKDYALGGFFRSLTSPTCFWDDGSTYAGWFKSNLFNNQGGIVRQTGDKIEVIEVGNGTDGPEPLNHPTPLPLVNSNGYYYYIQNEFHVDRFMVYRSAAPYDFTSDFSLVGYFGTDESYLIKLMNISGTTYKFITRTGNSPNGYDQSIITVDLDNPAGYTELVMTDCNYGSTNVRHYPQATFRYSDSQWYVGGICHRKDGTIRYYKGSTWLTQDGITFYNTALTFSKNVSTEGAITNTELEDHFTVFGTDSDVTFQHTEFRQIHIGEDIYRIYVSDDNNLTYRIAKQTIGSETITNYDFTLTDVFDSVNDNSANMYYNGDNITLTFKRDDGMGGSITSKYYINLDLTGFVHDRDINTPDGLYLAYPVNLHEVPRGKRFMTIGRSEIGTGGTVPITITNIK